MVMSARSVSLITQFLDLLVVNQYFVLILSPVTDNCPFCFLNQRKENRKYVAGPGIEPRTSGSLARRATDCATRPACIVNASDHINTYLLTGFIISGL